MKKIIFAAMVILLTSTVSCTFPNQGNTYDNTEYSEEDEQSNEDQGYYVLDQIPDKGIEFCPPQEITFITDFQVYQTPTLPEPAPRTAYIDPVFDTCIIRVTDRQNDLLNPADDSGGMKNEYARVQAFNADESLLLVRSTESFWYVYDAHTLQPLGEVPVSVEPRWDASDPYLLYYIDETRLMSYDLAHGNIEEIRDFADEFSGRDVAAVWTRYEGSPSYDTRYWGLLAQDSDWEPFAFLVYDRQNDSVVIREIPAGYSIDNVTISPLGNYFLASFDEYCEPGQLGRESNPCGLMVYDRNLENGRSLLRIIGHYDTVLDASGREVILYQDIDTDHISMLDLETGAVTPLLLIDFSHTAVGLHFSGRASGLPGWGLVSTYNGGYPEDLTWMDDVIFAIELKANGRVVRLAHTQSVYNEDVEQDYWAEPHVTVNHNFTRILFTSNWGRTGTEQVDMYMIVLPDDWIGSLP